VAYSIVNYGAADGVQTEWTFPFPYLDPENIQVRLNGLTFTAFSVVAGGMVRFDAAPPAGSLIMIYRNTVTAVAPVDFNDGSVLTERELDRLTLYILYTSQENVDWAGSVPVGGVAGPPIPGEAAGYIKDETPPPTPVGFTATAGLSFVAFEVTQPAYSQGHGHGRTVVYGKKWTAGPLPEFADATEVLDFQGTFGTMASEPATVWYFWAKNESYDGYLSAAPTARMTATTGQDVSKLLTALTGQVRESELHAALGTRLNGFDTSIAGAFTAITAEASTRSTVDGHVASLYTVRAEVTAGGKTIVGGFGLSGTSGGTAGATIDFGVRADKFWIGAPSGATGVSDVLPFVVQTTDQTVNGVLIPKGVYMDAAYIKNLTALTARLGNAWIDNAMVANLAANKITSGTLAVGQYITGGSFTGWAWPASGGGFAIGPNGFLAGNYGTGQWVQINSDGSLSMPGFTVSGGSATFSGALSAASGTFTGTLSAGTVSGGNVTGATITGGVIQTATSGKRVVINSAGNNEAQWYGDRGDGVIEVVASIGVQNSGDHWVATFGGANHSNAAIYARSSGSFTCSFLNDTGSAVLATTVSGSAVKGSASATFGAALEASASGGADGVYSVTSGAGSALYSSAIGGSGYGAELYGNATKAPLFLNAYAFAARPSNPTVGSIALIVNTAGNLRLCYGDGTIWRYVDGAGAIT
jgi:hypothetical protein